jgi:hypothetical protein
VSDNLRGSGLTTLAFALGPLLGAIIVVSGLVWHAAKYPERNEFDSLRKDVESLKLDMAVMRERSQRLDPIEQKLDAVLLKKFEEPPRKEGHGR